MGRAETGASGCVRSFEAFLLHLAEDGIISSAQLQLAKEALVLWRPSIQRKQEAGAEAQQPLDRPAAAKRGHAHHAGDNQEQHQGQSSPAVAPKRCRVTTSQLVQGKERALSAAAPQDEEAEGPLALLPDLLLDHLMSLLAAEPGGSSIRLACRWLRSAFDRRCSRLVFRRPAQLHAPQPHMLQLLLSNPCVRSLAVEEDAALLAWLSLTNAGRVLQRLERLSLRHFNLRDTSYISHCSKLQRLELQHCLNLGSLRALASYEELQHLDLRGCVEVEDLGPLASCIRLQHLDLRGCKKVNDLAPLASCVELQHLDLSGCSLVDAGPLASCTRLQHLDLFGCRALQDLSALSACAALQHLDFRFCAVEARDVAFLACCAELRCLGFAPSGVEDLRPLAACKQLRHLQTWGVDNLAPLAACVSLQCLDIAAGGEVQDLGPLAACVNLRRLTMIQCHRVVDLGPLAACAGITFLDLAGSRNVQDLGPLASLAELQVLDLSFCTRVAHLRPLAACVNLKLLRLSACTGGDKLRPLAALSCRIVLED